MASHTNPDRFALLNIQAEIYNREHFGEDDTPSKVYRNAKRLVDIIGDEVSRPVGASLILHSDGLLTLGTKKNLITREGYFQITKGLNWFHWGLNKGHNVSPYRFSREGIVLCSNDDDDLVFAKKSDATGLLTSPLAQPCTLNHPLFTADGLYAEHKVRRRLFFGQNNIEGKLTFWRNFLEPVHYRGAQSRIENSSEQPHGIKYAGKLVVSCEQAYLDNVFHYAKRE